MKIFAPIPFFLYTLEMLYLLEIMFFEIKKKKDTSIWDTFGPWISRSSELLRDDGLQKACCVHKHMEVVWHFCKYCFVQSYCLEKKKGFGNKCAVSSAGRVLCI